MKSAQPIEKIWRPRRDLNPCYRRESGMAKRNYNELQERGRTGWRSRSNKKQLIVSPMCPRTFDLLEHFPAYLAWEVRGTGALAINTRRTAECHSRSSSSSAFAEQENESR